MSKKLRATALLFSMILTSCNSASPVSGGGGVGDLQQRQIPAVPVPMPPYPNLVGIPADLSANTGEYLFDESINRTDGFGIYQADPRLKDLFSAQGVSELCWPTSLANAMAFQKLWRSESFPSLKLTVNPGEGDYTQQVRSFADFCHTDHNAGTTITNAADCIRRFYAESGYPGGWAFLIGPESQADPTTARQHPENRREVSVDDLRAHVGNDEGVILELYYEKYDPQAKKWTETNGHYVMVVGYDYDRAWGSDRIDLKIVNPDIDYSENSPEFRFDTVSMLKVTPDAGVAYPAGAGYFLDGTGFRGIDTRGFVRHLVVFLAK